jgi:hypothetical protein
MQVYIVLYKGSRVFLQTYAERALLEGFWMSSARISEHAYPLVHSVGSNMNVGSIVSYQSRHRDNRDWALHGLL